MNLFLMFSRFIFNMPITRGSGSGVGGLARPRLTSNDTHEMITNQVTKDVREAIPEIGSIKTTMIEFFDERYATMTEVAAAASTIVVSTVQWRGSFQYRDFNNMKPLHFDEIKDPIVSMRLLYDVEGCLFT